MGQEAAAGIGIIAVGCVFAAVLIVLGLLALLGWWRDRAQSRLRRKAYPRSSESRQSAAHRLRREGHQARRLMVLAACEVLLEQERSRRSA